MKHEQYCDETNAYNYQFSRIQFHKKAECRNRDEKQKKKTIVTPM